MQQMSFDIPEDIIMKCIQADKKAHEDGRRHDYEERYRAGIIAVLQTFLEAVNESK